MSHILGPVTQSSRLLDDVEGVETCTFIWADRKVKWTDDWSVKRGDYGLQGALEYSVGVGAGACAAAAAAASAGTEDDGCLGQRA
jgi:hypothetical protein